jgi:hypothetical protein
MKYYPESGPFICDLDRTFHLLPTGTRMDIDTTDAQEQYARRNYHQS